MGISMAGWSVSISWDCTVSHRLTNLLRIFRKTYCQELDWCNSLPWLAYISLANMVLGHRRYVRLKSIALRKLQSVQQKLYDRESSARTFVVFVAKVQYPEWHAPLSPVPAMNSAASLTKTRDKSGKKHIHVRIPRNAVPHFALGMIAIPTSIYRTYLARARNGKIKRVPGLTIGGRSWATGEQCDYRL